MNVFIVQKPNGEWTVEAGGRVTFLQRIGPYGGTQQAYAVLNAEIERLKRLSPAPSGILLKRTPGKKEEMWRRRRREERTREWKQIGGDFGDPMLYDGMWRKGETVIYLQVKEEGNGWEIYQMDLSGLPRMEGINWRRIQESFGDREMPHDPVQRAEMAARYYGWYEVAGEPTTFKSGRRTANYLQDIGIDVIWQRAPEELTEKQERTLAEWRQDGYDRASLRGMETAYLRLYDSGFGEQYVETSWGESMAIDKVYLAMTRILRCITEWIEGGEQRQKFRVNVGGFVLTEIDEYGVVTLGCHNILAREVIRFFKEELKQNVGELVERWYESDKK